MWSSAFLIDTQNTMNHVFLFFSLLAVAFTYLFGLTQPFLSHGKQQTITEVCLTNGNPEKIL